MHDLVHRAAAGASERRPASHDRPVSSLAPACSLPHAHSSLSPRCGGRGRPQRPPLRRAVRAVAGEERSPQAGSSAARLARGRGGVIAASRTTPSTLPIASRMSPVSITITVMSSSGSAPFAGISSCERAHTEERLSGSGEAWGVSSQKESRTQPSGMTTPLSLSSFSLPSDANGAACRYRPSASATAWRRPRATTALSVRRARRGGGPF